MARTTQREHTTLSIYRHRGWYHIRKVRRYMWPLLLGIKFADEIPRDPKAYQGWLKLSRETLDDRLERVREESGLPDQDYYTGHGYTITRRQPRSDNCFEIDLDNEVFHVGSMPMFSLDNLPRTGSILRDCIAYDSYGHPVCSASTPEKCRYNWKALPPQVSQAVVDHYRTCSEEDPVMPIHELLGVSETMLAPEATCVKFFQEIVKCGMALRRVARYIRYLEKFQNRDEIPDDLLTFGLALVGLSRGPFVYRSNDHNHVTPKHEHGYTWLNPRTCLRITTHLDDERNLQATVADLVKTAMGRPHTHGIVYGIGFSFFHCVIVRINVDNHGSVRHTPVLQFLPSFYAPSSSTPGITALVRLGFLSEPLDLLGIPLGKLPSTHLLNNIPLELWSQIAHHLFSIDDIITLGSVSPLAWVAASALLKFPHVGEGRIVDLESFMPSNIPAEFGIVHDGKWPEQVEINALAQTGRLYFQCEWEDFKCECTDKCHCSDGHPWEMAYLCYD